MKKIVAWSLCLVLALGCALPALASEASGIAAEQVWREVYASEMPTFDYLYESTGETFGNYIEGLIEKDKYGIVQPCQAESWEISEDGTVYTFHIRPEAKWFRVDGTEYGDVTAHDFVYSAKHILTAANGSKVSDILTELFVGAQDFFSGTCEWDAVGVKALDDKTLEYTLVAPISHFMSILPYCCFLPANEAWVTEQGDKWGTDNQSWLYNSAFIMTEFLPQNRRLAVKNENYWDADRVYITRIEQTYNLERSTLAPIMAQKGEVTTAVISADMIDSWYSDPVLSTMVRPNKPGDSAYQFFYLFNFWPNWDENVGGSHEIWLKAVNNEAFRKSFHHGLDRINALQTRDPYSPENYLTNTITTTNFVYANGVSYSQMGDLAQYTNTESYNPELALEYKAQAIEELTALGVPFPVKVYMPYNAGSITNWTQRAQVVEQQMEELLGLDYIDFVIDGYPATDFLNTTRRAGNYGWMECYWGADFQDPSTYCDPFRLAQVYNFMWFADGWAEQTDENDPAGTVTRKTGYWKNYIYEEMFNAANAIQIDLYERYLAFANLEAWYLSTGIVTPLSNDDLGFVCAYYNPFDRAFDPFGNSEDRYKGFYLYNHPMGFDEYDDAYAIWKVEMAEAIANVK